MNTLQNISQHTLIFHPPPPISMCVCVYACECMCVVFMHSTSVTRLTGKFLAEVLDIYVGSAVGMCADEDGGVGEEGEEEDALSQCPGLATTKWSQHQGGDLGGRGSVGTD